MVTIDYKRIKNLLSVKWWWDWLNGDVKFVGGYNDDVVYYGALEFKLPTESNEISGDGDILGGTSVD